MAMDDSLEQCLTTTWGKTRKNKLWEPKFGSNRPKSGPKFAFFGHFLKFASLDFLDIPDNDSLQHLEEVKPMKKTFGDQIWTKTGQDQV